MPSLESDEYVINIKTKANTTGATEAKDALEKVGKETQKVDEKSKSAGGALSSMAGQFAIGNIAANIATDAFSKVKDQLTDTIQVAEQNQNMQAQLANSLKVTGDASGMSMSSLNDLADATQKNSNFDKIQVAQAENVALTFKGIGKDVFPQVITQATNMAQKFGMDLPSATKMLGIAMQDPAKGMTLLRRDGVVFTASQQAMIKSMEASGNTMGAQKYILDQLQHSLGGSAAAAANTFQGKITHLKFAADDLKISIGTHLINAFQKMANVYTKHSKLINDVAIALGILIGVITIGVGVMKAIEMAQKAWTAATTIWSGVTKIASGVQMAFNAVMDANPIALVILAIVALIAIGVLLITHWKEVTKMAKKVWDDVVGFFTGLWQDVVHIFDSIVKAVEDHFKLILAVITGPIGLIVYFVTSHFQQILDFIKNIGKMIVNAVSNFGSLLYDAGKNLIMGLIHGVTDMAGKAVDAVKNVGKGIINGAKDILKIFSPSKVFHEIGLNVGAGLTGGMNASQTGVMASSSSLAASAIQGASSSLGGNSISNSSSTTMNSSSSQIQIGQIILPGVTDAPSFMQAINSDAILVKNGLTPSQGMA